jgi:hypothetical protein
MDPYDPNLGVSLRFTLILFPHLRLIYQEFRAKVFYAFLDVHMCVAYLPHSIVLDPITIKIMHEFTNYEVCQYISFSSSRLFHLSYT